MAKSGDVISEYVLVEKVGEGATGEVWMASRKDSPGESVCVRLLTNPEAARIFRSEHFEAASIKHNSIVEMLERIPSHHPPAIVSEFVRGKTLREILGEKQVLGVPEAIEIGYQVLEGLAAAHARGLFHGDMKPGNLFITSEGVVKISDFGLAPIQRDLAILYRGMLKDLGEAQARSLQETLSHLAPEQREDVIANARSDVFSVGLVLYEVLTGTAVKSKSAMSDIPDDIVVLLDRATSEKPIRRHQNASQLQEELARAARASGIDADIERCDLGLLVTLEKPSRCGSCNALLDGGDFFCIVCGRQVAARVPRCPQCGGFYEMVDTFCIVCGKRLR